MKLTLQSLPLGDLVVPVLERDLITVKLALDTEAVLAMQYIVSIGTTDTNDYYKVLHETYRLHYSNSAMAKNTKVLDRGMRNSRMVFSNSQISSVFGSPSRYVDYRSYNYTCSTLPKIHTYLPLKRVQEATFDSSNNNVILHSTEYRGPLEKAKNYKEISRALSEAIIKVTSVISLQNTLVPYTELDDNTLKNSLKVSEIQELLDEVTKRFSLVIENENECTRESVYIIAGILHKIKTITTNCGSYYEIPKDFNIENVIKPSVRRYLLFSLGAFKVPENYKEWFKTVNT